MVAPQLEIFKIQRVLMDHFKKNLKYMVEKEKFVREIIVRVLLLSFFKLIDQHICVKLAKNKNFNILTVFKTQAIHHRYGKY